MLTKMHIKANLYQLQDKLEKLAPKKSLTENTNESSTDFFPYQSAKVESYILLAKLSPADEYFELNAWLKNIDDHNSVPNKKSSKFISLIDSNETRMVSIQPSVISYQLSAIAVSLRSKLY
ncbi:MAG: hypothetical protein F6K23_10240 [Okeania sp. SIO2C9]|uniref:hypothetical protein n=1 Tax=Okeania sp. SIO2C9 TaxID=2607791 RepID=UPI0013BFD070|nr:hypothetical protein [Okeania sp. SIO2C9]NEQ73414.1 hypothetical protein [Okeania sp. SIO2C9]